MLLYISDNDATVEEAAIWWLQNNGDQWTGWVPDDVADDVRDALDNE